MRILFANTVPLVTRGLGPALAELGHQTEYVFLDQEESLLPFIEKFQPDLVFNDGGTNRMHKLFPLLDDLNIPHVYWAIEDPAAYAELSLPYALKSPLVFTACQESLASYTEQGINAHLLMFACNPVYHCPQPFDYRFNHDLIFVGNNYNYHPARIHGNNTILSPLIAGGYDLKVYGNEWWLDPEQSFNIPAAFYGGYMANEDLPAACSSARIMLGLHSVDTSLTMMSMRTFEILGSRGFYLTQWTPAIENYFINHHHLVWTRSAEETVDLVNFYLARPDLRERIARQGQEEVYARHTYQQRAAEINTWLNMSAAHYNSLTMPDNIRIGRRGIRISL